MIDSFYSQEFGQVQSVCGFSEAAKEVVLLAKKIASKVVLATNPIFPAVATENRMRWAGLVPEDFTLYTTYENSCNCKPNPQYYIDIAEKIGCKPQECLMIGNDVAEDMVAATVGMRVFLLTDCLINKKEQDISEFAKGGFQELMEYLDRLA